MVRDQETLDALLDAVNRFTRDELVPAEAEMGATDPQLVTARKPGA